MKKNKIVFKIISLLLIAGLAALATGCAKQASPTASTDQNAGKKNELNGLVIRLATQPSQTQPAIAEVQGFFKEEFEKDGITVELKTFASGPPIIEAFAAGELDFGQVGDQPAIQGRANGIDLKAIASYMSSNTANALIARKDSGIKSLADLKGKKIGYTTGSVAHQLLLKFLEAENYTEDDVELLNLTPGDIYTALESNNIDGAVIWEPYITKSVAAGSADIIQDATGYKYSVSVLVGKEAFLQKYPDVTVRLLKVLDKAAKWSDEHKEESIKILSERSSMDPSAFEASFQKYDFMLYLDEDKINSIKDSAAYLYKQELIRKEVDVNQLIDTSFLDKAGIKK